MRKFRWNWLADDTGNLKRFLLELDFPIEKCAVPQMSGAFSLMPFVHYILTYLNIWMRHCLFLLLFNFVWRALDVKSARVEEGEAQKEFAQCKDMITATGWGGLDPKCRREGINSITDFHTLMTFCVCVGCWVMPVQAWTRKASRIQALQRGTISCPLWAYCKVRWNGRHWRPESLCCIHQPKHVQWEDRTKNENGSWWSLAWSSIYIFDTAILTKHLLRRLRESRGKKWEGTFESSSDLADIALWKAEGLYGLFPDFNWIYNGI